QPGFDQPEITCGQWWLDRPDMAEFRDIGFQPGGARWIDEHVHTVCGVDFFSGSRRKMSDGCYGGFFYGDECTDPVYEGRWSGGRCGIESTRAAACAWWGCTGHAQCRPCEGICM